MKNIFAEANDKLSEFISIISSIKETLKRSKQQLEKDFMISKKTSSQSDFIFNAIERKTNNKIKKYKNISKKLLLSRSLDKKLEFIDWFNSELNGIRESSISILSIKQTKDYLSLIHKIYSEEERFLQYLEEMLEKQIKHTDKLQVSNIKIKTVKKK